MNLIRQEDRSGCGLACVAMVTGMDYAAVRRIWLECLGGDAAKLDRAGDGLTAGDIIHLLAHIGVRTLRVEHEAGTWTISGAGDCWSIQSTTIEHGLRHWVVADRTARILDPAEDFRRQQRSGGALDKRLAGSGSDGRRRTEGSARTAAAGRSTAPKGGRAMTQEIDYLNRAREFDGPIRRLADQNPIVRTIVEHYARGEIVTKEEALSQMVVQLGKACLTTQAEYVDLMRRSCLPMLVEGIPWQSYRAAQVREGGMR